MIKFLLYIVILENYFLNSWGIIKRNYSWKMFVNLIFYYKVYFEGIFESYVFIVKNILNFK